MARPQRPHKCSWDGKLIQGLYKCPDGRWRITATGQKFTEPDERKAVARFLAMQKTETVDLPVATIEAVADLGPTIREAARREVAIDVPLDRRESMTVHRVVTGLEFWAKVKELLLTQPEYVAKMTGLGDLAGYRHNGPGRPPVRIDRVRESFLKHSPASEKAKREALAPFDKLVKFAEAKTLDDLTDARLAAWRDEIVSRSGLNSSATISGYFSRVRNVLRIAWRGELDALQIDAAISRCRAKLYSPPSNVQDDPQPISRENFRKLLETARETDVPNVWRAMLLLGLNAALYMEDLCDLQWEALDLEAGTLVSRRKKTGKCIRVATLWPETVTALRAIPRRGNSPYVFTSARGTRYNKNTKINDFADLRVKAGIEAVKWSHIRDGAYTAPPPRRRRIR